MLKTGGVLMKVKRNVAQFGAMIACKGKRNLTIMVLDAGVDWEEKESPWMKLIGK